jgi:nitrogen fixation protein FixH
MMRETGEAVGRKQFTGRHMLFTIGGFFAVVISVNILMAVAASSTWTGLVVANSYVASQEFQVRADAARRQREELGWRGELSLAKGRVRVSVVDRAGAPVPLGEVSVKVNRPVGGRDDRALTLAPGADGAYEAPLSLTPGVWDVTVTAPQTAAGPFELHRRLTVATRIGP